jgi:hypothetical protein
MWSGRGEQRVRRTLADSWPRNATPMEAVGYLVGAHVPVRALPDGPALLRAAAGWPAGRPPGALEVAGPDIRAYVVRSWLARLQEHAARLGPPPGLLPMLRRLGDGRLRGELDASRLLQRAGAGPDASAKVLVDVARWCGADLPFAAFPVARPGSAAGAQVYARDGADLRRARGLARARLGRTGLLAPDALLRSVTRQGVRVETGAEPVDLRHVLDVAGTVDWVWPHHANTPLVRAMNRIRVLGGPVPVARIPAAVVRTVYQRRPPVPGEWPIPVAAVRAWAADQRDWVLTAGDEMVPVGPPQPARAHDELLAATLREVGGPIRWTDLVLALEAAGLPYVTASSVIYSSPLLHRQGDGYVPLSST